MPRQTSIGPLQVGIMLLTAATAVIHLQLNYPDPMFILNGIGYLVLLGALYMPIAALAGRRRAVRLLLMAYTAVTIIGWALIATPNMLGYVTKAIEFLLMGLLWMENQVHVADDVPTTPAGRM